MPSKGRKVPPAKRSFLGADADVAHAFMNGLVINWMQLQEIDGKPLAVFDVDLSKRPDIAQLLTKTKANQGLSGGSRSKWNFMTAAVGPDEGKTFIVLHFEINPPNECTFDLVFVEGDHSEALDGFRSTGGWFALGSKGNAMLFRAPIEDLDEGLRNHKIGLGIAGDVTPSA